VTRGGGHFDGIVASYAHSMQDLATIYEQAARVLAPIVRDRIVLDVGAGGTFAYDESLPEKLIALDVSANMLAQIDNPRVEIVVDDATTMRSIPDASVDVVMFCLVLHHINEPTRAGTLRGLANTLATAVNKLRPGGHVAILEVLAPGWLYCIEAPLFAITKRLLRWRGRDMIFMYTASQITEQLTSLLEGAVETYRLKLPEFYDPLAGSFPGKIRIPGALSPTPFELFVARK